MCLYFLFLEVCTKKSDPYKLKEHIKKKEPSGKNCCTTTIQILDPRDSRNMSHKNRDCAS